MKQVPRSSAGLESAWRAGSQPSTQGSRPLSPFAFPALRTASSLQPAWLEIPSPAAHPAVEACVSVVIASCWNRASALFEPGLLASRHRAERMYRIEHAEMDSIADLEACCRQRVPRLLLVDIALISTEGIGQLDDLRRSFPGTDWLLGWEHPSTKGLDAAIRIQARGCIEWGASADQFAQSLDAVLAGTLGFPNPVLQALYLSVLRLAVAGERSALAAPPAVRLTAREHEVLSLMNFDMSNKQIAEQLGISVNTVKKHLAHVFAKQGQHSRRWHLARPGLTGPLPERLIPHIEPAASRYPVEKLNAAPHAGYLKNMFAGQFPRISYHLDGSMDDDGLLQTATPTIVSQLACHAGWPNVFSTVPVMKSIFRSQGK